MQQCNYGFCQITDDLGSAQNALRMYQQKSHIQISFRIHLQCVLMC